MSSFGEFFSEFVTTKSSIFPSMWDETGWQRRKKLSVRLPIRDRFPENDFRLRFRGDLLMSSTSTAERHSR